MNAKAIETEYNGYRFRSRTEARWAVFFDVLGLKYEYEKEGYDLGAAGHYLPDFWLPDLGLWVEIKGGDPSVAELRKAKALCEATKDTVAIFAGPPWYSIARALFEYNGAEDEAIDSSYWSGDDDFYDYEKQDGDGCYYQGWSTWGLTEHGYRLIVLVESDDVFAAHGEDLDWAYLEARGARFEHGEKPNPSRLRKSDVNLAEAGL